MILNSQHLFVVTATKFRGSIDFGKILKIDCDQNIVKMRHRQLNAPKYRFFLDIMDIRDHNADI